MAPDVSVPQLSVARINRLLRPLRNRCSALAAFTSETSRSFSHATYSSAPVRRRATSQDDLESPPLEILQPPGSILTRTYLLKNNAEKVEMSRKVYAIRDCFKEIVLRAQEQARWFSSPQHRILSLSALCSIIVGQNMQYETDNGNDDDVEGTNFMNELYEAVPLEYRRWTVLSHSVNTILEIGTHNATLFSILLDVTLAHKLLYESTAFLQKLFLVALSPTSSNTTPCIVHPAHANFLLDLRARWNESELPDNTFLRIFIETLAPMQNLELWVCKAVKRLARSISGNNFPMFVQFLIVCMEMTVHSHTLRRRSVKPDKQEPVSHKTPELQMQLCKWINVASDCCLSISSCLHSYDPSVEISRLILNFIQSSLALDVANGKQSQELCDTVVCLCTQWLSTPHISLNTADLVLIIHWLGIVNPRPSTYGTLVQKLFSELVLKEAQETIQRFTQVLRSHHLLYLEASLWGCTLHHIECQDNSFMPDELNQYRHQLIDAVDDAEKRCYGSTPNPSSFTPSRRALVTLENEASRGWEWEEMTGCWVRKLDLRLSVKRRKTEEGYKLRSSTFLSRHQSHNLRPINTMPGRFSNQFEQTRFAEYLSKEDPRIFNSENDHQPSNFTSLLADAFFQRKNVHTPQKAHIQPGLIVTSPESRPPFPPSDDSLDLFACIQSSPTTSY